MWIDRGRKLGLFLCSAYQGVLLEFPSEQYSKAYKHLGNFRKLDIATLACHYNKQAKFVLKGIYKTCQLFL